MRGIVLGKCVGYTVVECPGKCLRMNVWKLPEWHKRNLVTLERGGFPFLCSQTLKGEQLVQGQYEVS